MCVSEDLQLLGEEEKYCNAVKVMKRLGVVGKDVNSEDKNELLCLPLILLEGRYGSSFIDKLKYSGYFGQSIIFFPPL